LKASLLGKIASERLVEQEEAAKKMSRESRKLKRDFNLAQAANLDLEKKVAELADALKKCQDEKRSHKMGRRLPKKPLSVRKKILKSYKRLMMRT
jgi:hypothetical protein